MIHTFLFICNTNFTLLNFTWQFYGGKEGGEGKQNLYSYLEEKF